MKRSAALRISTPGKQSRLAQNLEAIADAEHQPAAPGMGPHRIHDRRPRSDGAAAQIVAIGKAAGNDHEIGAGRQRGVGVPHHGRFGARHKPERARHVALAIDAGEDDDGGFHGSRSAHPSTSTR